MPVTQKWVHGGLVLAVGLLSLSLTVLILWRVAPERFECRVAGGRRPVAFYLPDAEGKLFSLDDQHRRPTALIFAESNRGRF